MQVSFTVYIFHEKKIECSQIFTFLLQTEMQLAVQKNHSGGQIVYRSFDPSKKRRQRD